MRTRTYALITAIGLGLVAPGMSAWAVSGPSSFNVSIKGYELINGVRADIKGVGEVGGTAAGALSGGILTYSAVNPVVGITPQSDTCTGAINGTISNPGTFGLYLITLDYSNPPPPTGEPPVSPLCASQTLTLSCTRSDAPVSNAPSFLGGAYVCTATETTGTGITAASLSVELSAPTGISPAL